MKCIWLLFLPLFSFGQRYSQQPKQWLLMGGPEYNPGTKAGLAFTAAFTKQGAQNNYVGATVEAFRDFNRVEKGQPAPPIFSSFALTGAVVPETGMNFVISTGTYLTPGASVFLEVGTGATLGVVNVFGLIRVNNDSDRLPSTQLGVRVQYIFKR